MYKIVSSNFQISSMRATKVLTYSAKPEPAIDQSRVCVSDSLECKVEAQETKEDCGDNVEGQGGDIVV